MIIAGWGAIVGGVWLIHPPSAIVLSGFTLVALAVVVRWWRGQPIGRKIPGRGADE